MCLPSVSHSLFFSMAIILIGSMQVNLAVMNIAGNVEPIGLISRRKGAAAT